MSKYFLSPYFVLPKGYTLVHGITVPKLSLLSIAISLIASLLVYHVGYAVYNLCFHPLSKYPGPKLWAISRIPYAWNLRGGRLIYTVKGLHEKYGHVVRLAPNELSFTDGAAWKDIFQHRQGHQVFQKHGVWLNMPVNGSPSILNANDIDHARIKRLLGHAFSDKALRKQEALMRAYVDLLMIRLKERVEAGEETVNIVKYYDWSTADVIGDLAFGTSFECLLESKYHPWVEIILGQTVATTFLTSCRYFPLLSKALIWSLPKSITERRWQILRHAQDKITQRMNTELSRPDFVSYVQRYNDEKGMTRDEIDSTFTILINAGGETTATFLSGTTHYLLEDPASLRRVTEEVRSAFKSEEEMTNANIEKLPFLGAVVKEGLRLIPSVPMGHPRVVPPGGDSVAGYDLPGGTVVSIAGWAACRQASNFTEPDAFRPNRWLEYNGFDDRTAYQPFGIGPRMCIGKSLALLELRLILARLLWNFDLRIPGGATSLGYEWQDQRVYLFWEKRPLLVQLMPSAAPAA